MQAPAEDAGPRRLPHASLWLLLPALWVLACGTAPAVDGDPDAGTDPDTELPDGGDGEEEEEEEEAPPILTLEDQLKALGFDVEGIQTSPRPISDAVALDRDVSPLGNRFINASREWVIAGAGGWCRAGSPAGPLVRLLGAINDPCLWSEISGEKEPRYGEIDQNIGLNNPGSQSTRTMVSGTFSTSELEQLVVFNAHRPRSFGWQLTGWNLEGEVIIDHALPSWANVLDAASATGDFNGDGLDDIVVGLLHDSQVALHVYLQQPDRTFDRKDPSGVTLLELEQTQGSLSLSLDAGRLDGDAQDEVVLLVRWHHRPGGVGQPKGEVHAYIFDQPRPTDGVLPLLSTRLLTYTDPEHGAAQPVRTATVALGDFDADGLDEIAISGIGRFAESYSQNYTYVTRILDDLAHDLVELATEVRQATHPSVGPSKALGYILEVFTHALEHDGDPAQELLANERVLKLGDGQLTEIYRYDHVISSRDGEPHSEANAAVGVGDVNGDGIDDVMAYQSSVDPRTPWSTSIIRQKDYERQRDTKSANGAYPLIVSLNSHHVPEPLIQFGATLEYVQGSHRTFLSAPLVHALIAAPPSSPADRPEGLEPSTTFDPPERAVSLPAREGASPIIARTRDSEIAPLREEHFETPQRLDAFMRWSRRALSASASIGSDLMPESAHDDRVLFSVVPYDAYDYVVRGQYGGFDADTIVTLLLPRAPITQRISREAFNASVPEGETALEGLRHTPGVPTSYLSYDEALNLVEASDAAGRWSGASEAVTVEPGEALLECRLELEPLFHEQLQGQRTLALPLTGGGQILDFTTGTGERVDLRYLEGAATAVVGRIPPLAPGSDGDRFETGLFTYVEHHPSGQVFPVVSYWVR